MIRRVAYNHVVNCIIFQAPTDPLMLRLVRYDARYHWNLTMLSIQYLIWMKIWREIGVMQLVFSRRFESSPSFRSRSAIASRFPYVMLITCYVMVSDLIWIWEQSENMWCIKIMILICLKTKISTKDINNSCQ